MEGSQKRSRTKSSVIMSWAEMGLLTLTLRNLHRRQPLVDLLWCGFGMLWWSLGSGSVKRRTIQRGHELEDKSGLVRPDLEAGK